jgi:hypothetical protein
VRLAEQIEARKQNIDFVAVIPAKKSLQVFPPNFDKPLVFFFASRNELFERLERMMFQFCPANCSNKMSQ